MFLFSTFEQIIRSTMADYINVKSLPIKLGTVSANIFMLKVKDAVYLTYVAVRGKDKEAGAVQRVLSPIRLRSVEEYVLKGNMFFAPFFFNWTNIDSLLEVGPDGDIKIPNVASSAQVLDGQHRLAGLSRAMEKDPSIGDKEIVVIMSDRLNTQDAAKVFLNINTEQKPVPASLIYDLFGEINKNDKDLPLVRAKDIATDLQNNIFSPYKGVIKFPGQPRGVGFIDLSTVVNSIKPLLENDGVFNRFKISNLENQTNVVFNFFNALKDAYDKENIWFNKARNPFFTNAGFVAAVDVLNRILVPKCAAEKDFTQNSFARQLNLNGELLQRSDIKNMDGKSQRKTISDFLEDSIHQDLPAEDGYKF